MLKVGLTGGIGAGKSAVAGLLARHGAVVVDADAIAREVVEPGGRGLQAVLAEFGPGVRGADGRLERARLAARGVPADEARARMAAQASDADRRAVADVLISNAGTLDDLAAVVDAVWRDRIGTRQADPSEDRPAAPLRPEPPPQA